MSASTPVATPNAAEESQDKKRKREDPSIHDGDEQRIDRSGIAGDEGNSQPVKVRGEQWRAGRAKKTFQGTCVKRQARGVLHLVTIYPQIDKSRRVSTIRQRAASRSIHRGCDKMLL